MPAAVTAYKVYPVAPMITKRGELLGQRKQKGGLLAFCFKM